MEKIMTPEFRVSFAHVFEPHAFSEGDEKKYSVVMLFDENEDLSKLKALAAATAKEKWGKKIPANMRNPFRKGSEKPNLDGYEGKIFVTASSKMKPGLVDKDVQAIIDKEEFYSGCYARATVTCYAYGGPGTKFTPGVAFGLQNIQKLRAGDTFSGRSKAEDDFDVFDTGDDDTDFSDTTDSVQEESAEDMFA